MPNYCQSGKRQSPINFSSNSSLKCEGNCELFFYYRSSTCDILNNSGELVLDYDQGSYIIFNSIVYELDKVSFTIPSSHKIDGSSYPMEVFLNHKSTDFGRVLIVSILVDINETSSDSRRFFDILVNSLPSSSGEEKIYNTPKDWNIYSVIPESKAFYTYTGSLPRPPCTESVTWIVMDSPINISSSVYQNIKSVIGKNSRQIQKKNKRKVYYNSNISPKCSRNYGSKLRCFTDEELRQKCSCMCRENQKYYLLPSIGSGFIFVLLCVVLVLVCVVVCVQWGLFDFSLKKFKNFIQYQPDELKIK